MSAREQLEAYASRGVGWARYYATHESMAPKAFTALRAVLDIHKPDSDGTYCEGCGLFTDESQMPYPCDTVKAITTALEASP